MDKGSESNICSAQTFTRIFINLSTEKKKSLHHAVKYNGAHIAGSKRGYFNLMMLLSTWRKVREEGNLQMIAVY